MELTIEQWLEKYPYLRKVADTILFVSKEEFETYQDGPQIELRNGTEEKNISVKLLEKLVSNDNHYEYVKKLFMGQLEYFRISYIINGDTAKIISLSKTEIVMALRQAVSQNSLDLDDLAANRMALISNRITFERFLEKYRGYSFSDEIDGNKVVIPIEYMAGFMLLPPEQYDDFFDLEKEKNIGGIPKEYLIYTICKFFKQNNIFDEYLMPEQMVNRYNELYALKKIDVQALNRITTTNDENLNKTVINEQLKQAILNGIPEEASNLEKSIYIYIKMCKLLTYDDEFYAVNQMGSAAEKHEHIENVSNINLSNNKVVCYEFNAIYAKLLDELGIKFETDSKVMGGFGGGHANLCFRIGKYLVKADSVTSILLGDIMNAKLNQPLVGLECININENTHKEFIDTLSKMYSLVARQEQENKSIYEPPIVGRVETFEDILEKYKSLTHENNSVLTIEDKLKLLIDKVNGTKMVGIDSLSYILQLRKIIFTKEEREKNICVSIIRNNNPIEEGRVAMASAIFAMNTTDMKDNSEQNNYFFYNPQCELVQMTKEEIEETFKSGTFEYMNDKNHVPGIGDGISK